MAALAFARGRLTRGIPFIAKFEIGYHVTIEKKEDEAA